MQNWFSMQSGLTSSLLERSRVYPSNLLSKRLDLELRAACDLRARLPCSMWGASRVGESSKILPARARRRNCVQFDWIGDSRKKKWVRNGRNNCLPEPRQQLKGAANYLKPKRGQKRKTAKQPDEWQNASSLR